MKEKACGNYPTSKGRQHQANKKMPPPPRPAMTLPKHKKSSNIQWYLLGMSIFLMSVTTCLRVTLHLVNQQSSHREQEGVDGAVPADLVQHLRALPNSARLVQPDDFIYEFKPSHWDSAPIVLEEYKLIFFAIPKVACTTFKQLFRRMTHLQDWKSQDPKKMLPHNPETNGLTYLWNYTLEQANDFMTRPDYTRAIFVRDPKHRFLSAFLDKGLGNFGNFIRSKCCPRTWARTWDCVTQAQTSSGFLELIQECSDPHWDPQTLRMEPKYWPYINFVGQFERLDQDGPRLLKQIGAWKDFGVSGWGRHGNQTIFQRTSASDQTHTTGASNKIWEHLTPDLERKIEDYYHADYQQPQFGFTKGNLTRDFWIKGTDKIYAQGPWDGAPVVVEKYKLIFFTIPRVGDQIWKQAFRRMEGLKDWKETGGPKMLPFDPNQNGLKYLYHFQADVAERLIKDPTWTKAMFVRNPKDRFLEVYQHMSTHPEELRRQCCPNREGCENQAQSLVRLLDLTLRCKSDQWHPQSHRMEEHYWKYINFLGRMESVEEDSKRLLEKIGAWQDIGASGWGDDGTERIFAPTGHENDAVNAALVSYTAVVDRLLEDIYKEDLENKFFEFPKKPTPLL